MLLFYECVRADLPNVLPDDLKNIVFDYARFVPRPSAAFYRGRRYKAIHNFIYRFKEESFDNRYLNYHVIPLFCVAHYNKNPNWHTTWSEFLD